MALEPDFYTIDAAAKELDVSRDTLLQAARKPKPDIKLAIEINNIAVYMDLEFVTDPELVNQLTGHDDTASIGGLLYVDSDAIFSATRDGQGYVHWLLPVAGKGFLTYFTHLFSPEPEGVIPRPLEPLYIQVEDLVVPAVEVHRIKDDVPQQFIEHSQEKAKLFEVDEDPRDRLNADGMKIVDVLQEWRRNNSTKIDWTHWLGLPIWTPQEAAFLLEFTDPIRNRGSMHDSHRERIDKLVMLAERDQQAKKIEADASPAAWVAWAENKGITIPSQLAGLKEAAQAAQKAKTPKKKDEINADWQRQLESMAKELITQGKKSSATKGSLAKKLGNQIGVEPGTIERQTRKTW